MEARRTFEAGAKSSSKAWMAVAAFLAVLALGVSGAYFANGVTHKSAAAGAHVGTMVSTQGPDAQERNAKLRGAQSGPILLDRNAERSSIGASAPNDSRTGPQIAP